MKNLRESVGSAVASGDLTWNPSGEEAAPDRIVASAWAGERLGELLWRIKDAGERNPATITAAVVLIVNRISGRKNRLFGRPRHSDVMTAMCKAALDEWVKDECRDCSARGFIYGGSRPRQCGPCAGSGRLQWTEAQRRIAVGAHYRPKLYEEVIQHLQEAVHRQAKGAQRARG